MFKEYKNLSDKLKIKAIEYVIGQGYSACELLRIASMRTWHTGYLSELGQRLANKKYHNCKADKRKAAGASSIAVIYLKIHFLFLFSGSLTSQ